MCERVFMDSNFHTSELAKVLSPLLLASDMTFDLYIWLLVHLDCIEVRFEGHGYRSKFTITE